MESAHRSFECQPEREKDMTGGRNRMTAKLKIDSFEITDGDGTQMTVCPLTPRNSTDSTTAVPPKSNGGKAHQILRGSETGAEFVSINSSASVDNSHVSALHSTLTLNERKRKPGPEVVNAVEQKGAARKRLVVGAGDVHSVGNVDLQGNGQRNDVPTSVGKTFWNKLVRRIKAKFLTSVPISSRAFDALGKPIEVPEEGNYSGWICSLHNLFRTSKKHKNPRCSQMSDFNFKHQILQDGQFPTSSTVPAYARGLEPDAWRSNDIGPHHHLTNNGKRSERFIVDTSGKSNDADLQLQNLGMVLESTDSTPLLDHYFQELDALSRETRHFAGASSSQLAGGPSTFQAVHPPYILRKWKLRNSPKWLRIDPAKELLFHLTDDADKKLYACSIRLENKSKRYVAFKFKSTSPEGYLMKPKHGILAPNTRIEVRGFRREEPVFPPISRKKKDMFVVITLPLPAGIMTKSTLTISSSIFDRYQAQCCCEGVLYAVFCTHGTNTGNDSSIDGARFNSLRSSLSLGLCSIPEECDHQDQ